MLVQLECTYCGKVWEKTFHTQEQIEAAACECGDTTLKVRDANKTKVDYYQGCLPFPEKKEKEPEITRFGWPYNYDDHGSTD